MKLLNRSLLFIESNLNFFDKPNPAVNEDFISIVVDS
jgi:hypothetical protein